MRELLLPAAGGVLLAYLLGAVPFALLIGRAYGLDIRAHGSGNVGATNVTRVLGRVPGGLCLLLDAGKGCLPVIAARMLGWPLELAVLLALAALLGHGKSIFLGFKGGKSVATGAGAMLALAPISGLGALVVWGVVLGLTRVVSLASIAAAASLPIWLATLGAPRPALAFGTCAAIFIIWRHRTNLERLLKGTEPRVGRKQP